jgi:hypothetical protein
LPGQAVIWPGNPCPLQCKVFYPFRWSNSANSQQGTKLIGQHILDNRGNFNINLCKV